MKELIFFLSWIIGMLIDVSNYYDCTYFAY